MRILEKLFLFVVFLSYMVGCDAGTTGRIIETDQGLKFGPGFTIDLGEWDVVTSDTLGVEYAAGRHEKETVLAYATIPAASEIPPASIMISKVRRSDNTESAREYLNVIKERFSKHPYMTPVGDVRAGDIGEVAGFAQQFSLGESHPFPARSNLYTFDTERFIVVLHANAASAEQTAAIQRALGTVQKVPQS